MAILHDELNPRIFDERDNMRENIRETLLKIVQEFLDKLNQNEIPISVVDYRLVGSNAAYNYSPKSDMDIHIIADLSMFREDKKLLQLLYDYFKSNFNDKYDIKIKGMEVELYIEDASKGSISNGVYSIKEDKWIKKPKHTTVLDIDITKSQQYKDLIKQYQELKDEEVADFIDNLYVIRKVSLSKNGEFAEGNLIFKAFRDNGYLDALRARQAEIKSKELSLESLEEAVSPQGYAPKKTGKAYKVFKVKNGKLYPPMVANAGGKDTPIGVWLDAEEGEFAGLSKTGRPKVKSTGGEPLAYRPGWHLGDIPRAKQFDRLNKETGEYEFPKDFVWAECDYAMDVDYQPESDAQGYMRTKMDDKGNVITYKSDKYQHSLAGLPKLPKDGYYKYRTNPNPDTVPWVITGQMKVNRLLSDDEVNSILVKNGIEPIHRQGGDKTLKELGLNESLNEGAELFSRYDDVVNAELSAMNKFLDEFGFEVELQDNWKYGNYAGMFLNSIQDDASVFPIALNKKLIVKGSEDFTDLIYNIRGTLAHEVGHGLFEYLNDIIDLDDLDEEDTVEDFAYCYEDRCLDESELYRILINLDNYLNESVINRFNCTVKNLFESGAPGQKHVKEVLCDIMSLAGCDISRKDADKYILHHRDLDKNNYSINNLLLIPYGVTTLNGDTINDIHSKVHSVFRKKSSSTGSYDYDATKYMEQFKIINVYASILHGKLTYINEQSSIDVLDSIVVESLNEATLMHWGDLDYGRKADRRAIMAGRGTGHFGTGFYFVSKDKYDDMHYDYNTERPIYELDTDSYHLFKPKTVDDAYALHDALKSINDYAREDNVELLGYFDKCDRMHRDLNKLEDKIGYEDGWENEVLEFTKKYGAPWLVDRVEYMIQAENWYDLERFPKRIYDAYVESHDEVRDAIRTIEKITKTYRDLESIIPKAASHTDAEDSISTEVMKALGFEGIDVSHLQDENGWQSPDNFKYGSVIYDLKPNTYRRVKEPRGDYSLKYKK